MNFFFFLTVFLFGLAVGSFLNVVVDRMEKKESLRGRSYCDQCRHKLSFIDLIPLLSFFALKRRCRYCHSPISWQYPLVEFFSGFLFLIAAYYYFFSKDFYLLTVLDFFLTLYYLSSLIVIFVCDLKNEIIPDRIVLPAILVAILGETFLKILEDNKKMDFLTPLLLGFLAGGAFLIVFLLSRGEGMGGGDVKLAFLMGLVLPWPKILVAFYLAFLVGAMVSLLLIVLNKKGFKSTITFGPFLVLGTVVSMFWGEKIFEVYAGLW